VKAAIRNASTAGIKVLLDTKSTFTGVEEIVLQEAARAGRSDVVRYVLQQNPQMTLSEDVRYYAVIGGVSVWKELIAFDPDCVNVEIGHHGDAVGLAAGRNKAELLAFLLNETKVDIENSNYAGLPVLPFAISHQRSGEVVDLLIGHGARMKDEVDS